MNSNPAHSSWTLLWPGSLMPKPLHRALASSPSAHVRRQSPHAHTRGHPLLHRQAWREAPPSSVQGQGEADLRVARLHRCSRTGRAVREVGKAANAPGHGGQRLRQRCPELTTRKMTSTPGHHGSEEREEDGVGSGASATQRTPLQRRRQRQGEYVFLG